MKLKKLAKKIEKCKNEVKLEKLKSKLEDADKKSKKTIIEKEPYKINIWHPMG